LGNLVVRITANSTDAEVALARIKKGIAATFAIGAVDLFAHAISAGVKNSLALDRALAQVNTISEKALDPARVRELSNAIGIQAVDAANALYVAYSSGATNASQAFADVTAAATLARTTQTSLGSAVKAVTGLLNAYQAKGYDAAKITDILFQAAKDGVGSMDDFEAGLAKIVPTANILGLSLEEVSAELAASTVTLKSAPAAATGLSQVFNELSKSSTGAGKLFNKTFGHTFQQDLLKTHSGLASIQKLVKAVGQNNILDAFHAKGSGNAVELLITQLKDVNRAMEDTKNSAGTAADALAKVNASVSGQFNNLTVQASNALGTLADELKPVAQTWLPILSHWLIEITPHLRTFGKDVAAVSGWLASHKQLLQDVAGVIAIRLIPVLAGLTSRGLIALGTGLANAGLAFLGLSTRVGVAAAEVVAAEAKMAGATQALTLKMTEDAAAIGLAMEGMSAKTIVAMKGMAIQSVGTQATVGGALAGIGSRVTMAASNIGISLLVASTAWDMFGLKAKTGEGFIASAWDGIKYDTSKGAGEVLGALGNLTSGFGIFHNSVSNALDNTSTHMNAFGNSVISKLRQVDADVYDSAGHIITNLNMITQAGLAASGALTAGSDIQKALAAGGQLQQDFVTKQGFHLVDAATVARQQAERDMKNFQDSLASPSSGGGGGGLPGVDSSKTSQKASKIANALDNIKTSLVQLSQASQMSKDQLDSFFKQLEKDTKTVLSGSAEKAAIKLEKSWDDRLDKMVVRLDKFRKQVTDELQFGQQLKETVRGLGSVATATEGIGQTFFGIQNHLRAAVTNSQEFYKVLKKLDDAGLNDTSISQLAAAGPAALANAQALLSGGPQGIKSINALQGQLDSAGNSIANKTADNFYRAGQSISDGLLKGIQSKQKQLENQMDALGKKAAASFKKALGIHSPSRVMHGLGMNVTDGLANGIIAGSRKVERASAGMGGQVVFGAGSVVVSADGREPMHAGTMAGKGITSVLERQRAQSALRGLR
jgi:TP901 family phage tail tape measure protein